ncbi:MAG: cytochrome oxidase Cu insertion factor (SCO1/SenC/PrrC family), partial [Patiriisocius sp.]
MEKSTLITILVFAGILALVGAYTFFVQHSAKTSERDAQSSATLNASEETPYTDLKGNPFTFDDFLGQVRVVNAWAS